MRFLNLFFSLWLLLAVFGCNNADEAADGAKKGEPSAIFADYRISGAEGKEAVTCLLQFYEGGPRGASLLLDAPAGVQIDGEKVVPDSALRTGAYYELQKPVQAFADKHRFILTDEYGQQYSEEVTFEPLVLKTEPGKTIKAGEKLVLQVGGLLPGEKLRVVLTDINFDTEDINRLQTPADGQVILTAEDLQQLAPGPLTLMLFKEMERPLKDRTAAGGRLSIIYSLTRELELKR